MIAVLYTYGHSPFLSTLDPDGEAVPQSADPFERAYQRSVRERLTYNPDRLFLT